MNPPPDIAYVAEGKLYLQRGGQPAAPVESTFVQSLLDRAEKTRARNDWKAAGMSWDLGSRLRGPMAGGGIAADVRRVRFTGVAAGPASSPEPEMYYAIDTDYVGGLFHFELKTGYERRLYHRNQFRATDLSASPVDGTLAFTVHNPDGSARLATISPQGRGIKELTEGDAVDEAPSWDRTKQVLYFQSAGIARNTGGVRTSLSPYAIQKLDLDANKMEMVVEHDRLDALSPKTTDDGVLYYILRPYRPGAAPVSPLRALQDLLLFPFRLVRAVVHFLNVFSLMFSQKPLITSGGPPREGPDERVMMLWGRVVDARKAAKAGNADAQTPLVPADWRLVRRGADGSETVVARHVLSFDLCPGGGVIYSDGSRIYYAEAGAAGVEIGRGKMVERVTVLKAT
jgi:hypothetical protein